MDKPRKLTDDEIDDILSVIPDIKSAIDVVSKENTKSLKSMVKEQLRDIVLTPLGIPDLKQEIVRQYNETIIRPGSTVGLTSAESLAKPLSQGALNAFHTTGASKSVSTGIDRIKELVYATPNPKKTSCSIYFKNQELTFDDVIETERPKMTEITVADLVIGIPDIESPTNFDEPYWYSIYRTLIRSDFEARDVLRLELDVNLLYAYKLTMADVCRVIEQNQPVICVFSPLSVGQIDVYPIERLITAKLTSMQIVSSENASLVFLSMVVVPALDKLKISGISGIQQIYPIETPVWQIVKDELVAPDVQNGYHLILNTVRMKATGITTRKLVKLCQVAGMKVLKERVNYITVSMPSSNERPGQLILRLQKQDKEDEKTYEKRKREEGSRTIRRPATPFLKASTLVYAESTGANLKALLAHPEIDSTRTISNDVHEIQAALGIEAARNFFIQEFSIVLGFEGYINPRHIVLLVDFMASLGKIIGMTIGGVSQQSLGALEKASFQQAMDTFKEAAGFGEEKEIVGTSAAIYVGKKALIGTGFSSTFIDPTRLSRFEAFQKQLNEDPNLTVDVNTFNDAIESMSNIEFGTDIAILKGAEQAESEMFGVTSVIASGQQASVIASGQPVTSVMGAEATQPALTRVPATSKNLTGQISKSPSATITNVDLDPLKVSQVAPTRGATIRSAQLEKAASTLNRAPLLPIEIDAPSLGVGVLGSRPTVRVPLPATTGVIPLDLLEEAERLASKTSIHKPVPAKPELPVIFPPPLVPPAVIAGRKARGKPKIFDLEEFMK